MCNGYNLLMCSKVESVKEAVKEAVKKELAKKAEEKEAKSDLKEAVKKTGESIKKTDGKLIRMRRVVKKKLPMRVTMAMKRGSSKKVFHGGECVEY